MKNLARAITVLKVNQEKMAARIAELEAKGGYDEPTHEAKLLYFRRMAAAPEAERKAMLRQWNEEQEAHRG